MRMARRSLRTLCFRLLLLGFLPLVPSAGASQIRLKSGEVYTDATVIHREAEYIEIRVRYGTMTLPLEKIDTIDGVPVNPPAPPPRPLAPATARPAVQPSRRPVVIMVTPTIAPVPGLPTIAAIRRTPSPNVTGQPSLMPDWWPWRSGGVEQIGGIALGVIIILYLWSLTFPRLRSDMRDRPNASGLWYTVVLLLPGLGYLCYLLGRRLALLTERKRAEIEEQNHFEFLDADHNPILIDATSSVFSGIENAREILENALHKRASDIHIEPAAQEYRVRLRVDGSMLPDRSFTTNDGMRLVSALKTLAQVDIAERRKAQDGRFGARQGNRAVDFRAATVPSVHGEKLVLRILDRKSGVRGLNDLGMPQKMMDHFAQIVHSRSGMILATGPTGSGKTSTLYAALAQLDATQLNLVTIEDPVEYELAGATQIPVNAKAGVTYESGLRSILRQDPDVILVGEMRDLESAQIALRAALTGHLVFSSLHTRDAIGAVLRLEEMGIESHLIASALFVVLSQRLVRIVCDSCRQPYECAGNELSSLGIELEPGGTLYRAVGCRKCEGTGYLGRTGIFEMLVFDDAIRQPVNNGIEEDDLLRLAREKGFARFREDGAMKVLLGITTVDELLKVN